MINPVRSAVGLGGLLSVQEIVVWFADDDPGIREYMRLLLNQAPRLKLTRDFNSAEELIAALRVEPVPHVILLDLRLGGMSGVQAIKPIKQMAPETHVILFTSYFDFEARDAAMKAGATDFVLKRTPIGQLSEQIIKLFKSDQIPAKGVIAAKPIAPS